MSKSSFRKAPPGQTSEGWILELLHRLEAYGNSRAVAGEVQGKASSLTFLEFSTLTKKMATELMTYDLPPRSKVAIFTDSRKEYIPTLLGVLLAGHIAVPLDVKLSTNELQTILSHSETQLVIAGDRYQTNIENLSPVASLKGVLGFSQGPKSFVEKSWGQNISTHFPIVDEHDVSLLIYTSGTTSQPKGVMLSIDNIASQLSGIPNQIATTKSSLLSILPLSHMFNLTTELYALSRGASIYYKHSLLPHELLELFQQEKTTILICVPMVLESLKSSIEREIKRAGGATEKSFYRMIRRSHILPMAVRRRVFKKIHQKFGGNLGAFVCGGAPLSGRTFRFFENLGFKVVQGYGLTETSPICTMTRIHRRTAGCVGLPIEGVEIKVKPLVSSNIKTKGGVIWVRGRNIMLGYYKDEDATRNVLKEDGWLDTGDIGYMSAEGLYITGRQKSLIVLRGGKKVHPEEVEEVLSQSSLVEEVCVTSNRVHDHFTDSMVESVAAIVRPTELLETSSSQKNLVKYLQSELDQYKTQLSDYKWPTNFVILDEEFPKSRTHKIQRNRLQAMVEQSFSE